MEDGKKHRRETLLEAAILAAFFTLIIFLGPAAASSHRLSHDHPTGYAASDSYQHQARAEAIKQMGQYRNEAPYMMVGLTDVVGFYPPILYHITVLLSHLSGLETYDALFLIIGLVLTLGALTAYYLSRNLGVAAAVLSLPLTLFITTGKPFLGIMTFGQMPFALSALFLTATAWAITKLGLPRSYILIGIFAAGTAMAHTSETLFLAILMAALVGTSFAAALAREKARGISSFLRHNGKVIAAFAIGGALTAYFLPMFTGIWLKMQPYRFTVEKVSASFPAATFFIRDFGWIFLTLMIVGVIFAILLAIQKRREAANALHSPQLFTLAFSLYMFLAGMATYAGFGLRSFQTRLFWPITLAPLVGFGAYQLLKLATSRVRNVSLFPVAIVATILLSGLVIASQYDRPSPGSMSQEHWEALRWVAENTPENATAYVLYSHVYSQTSSLYNIQRVSYFLEIKEFRDIINKLSQGGQLDRMNQVTIAADSGAGLPYRKGLFSFGQRRETVKTGGVMDMCNADYYVIDLAFGRSPQEQVLGQANLYIGQSLLRSNMSVAYQNQAVTILKNNNVGGDCLG